MKLVTAVILSYNRQDVLRRQLLYYANKPVHLIFADGSDADWGSGESGSIGEMTWEYFKISGFNSYIARLQTAVKKIETEFMFFIDDEECILWTGVKRAVEFLKKNPDHSCAGGRADIMEFSSSTLRIRPWGQWSEPLALLQSRGVERLDLVFSKHRTANIFYQVLRTSDLSCYCESFDTSFRIDNRYPGFLEIALTGFLVLVGKWEMNEYPFWIRYRAVKKHSWESSPRFLTNSDANDLASILIRSMKSRAKKDNAFKIEVDLEQLARIAESCFGPQSSNTRATSNNHLFGPSWHRGTKKKVLKKMIRLSKVLFSFAPAVYEFLYPHGMKRLNSFAKAFGQTDPEVLTDIKRFEKIWFSFPYGLNSAQLSEELRLRANI